MQVLDAARYAIVQQTRKYDWLSAELAEAKQDVRDARLDEDDEDAVAEAKAEVARLKAERTAVSVKVDGRGGLADALEVARDAGLEVQHLV